MSGFAGFPNMPSFPGVGAGSPFGNQFNPGDFQFTGQNESLEMFQGTDPSGMGPSQLEASLFGGMGGPAPSPQFGQGWQQPHTGPAIDAESFGYNQPGPGQPYQRMEGGIKYTMSIEQMNNKIEQANRDSGRMGGAGTELMQALMADMQNTMASEQFRVDAANKLAAMGLQLGREGSASIIEQAAKSQGNLQQEAERLSGIGEAGVDATMKFNEQRYGKVDRLVRDAIEQAEKTLAKFDADTLDFNDETIARTASINIAMHRRASMRMAELQAKGSVGAGAGAEEARQEMQQLAMDTQFAADDTLSQLEMQRNQMLQRSFEVSAQLGGSISQTQIAGANTLGQLSAAQGGQLQQALSNQLGFETLANANTQLGENLQAAAQTNAMQFELLGMQFARDTYQAPHYPSFLEGLLAIKALPPGAMQGPATGLMAGLRSSAAQGMFA